MHPPRQNIILTSISGGQSSSTIRIGATGSSACRTPTISW
jgi:hypothetical protein